MSVDIAAPGQDVWVEVSEGDQTFVSGTSVAVAFVTGAAALLKSSDNDLTAAEIKNILIETAHTSESLKGLCAAGGYLDVFEALKYDLNLRGE